MPAWKNLVSSKGRSGGSPLDVLRKKLTKGLEIRVDQPEARRGEQIGAVVVVTEPERLGQLEAGLVCTEHYDEEVSSSDADGGHSTSRSTSRAIEHEDWQLVECIAGEHRVSFTIPAHAPYSYEGDCLSFRWEVVARGRRSGLDAQAAQGIAVHP
jgi:hypothetical protein